MFSTTTTALDGYSPHIWPMHGAHEVLNYLSRERGLLYRLPG